MITLLLITNVAFMLLLAATSPRGEPSPVSRSACMILALGNALMAVAVNLPGGG